MKEIELSQNKVAVVDDEDFEWLSQWKWYATKSRNTFYAVRDVKALRTDGTQQIKVIHMHRFILDAPIGVFVDHKDGDGLNNSRQNIRIATKHQNEFNQGLRLNNTSGYRGVSLARKHKPLDADKWRAGICLNQKYYSLGAFGTREEAARAYDAKAKELFGEFARLNFP